MKKTGDEKKNEIKTRGEIEESILHGASEVGQEQVGGAEGTHTQLHSLTAEWRDVNVECIFFLIIKYSPEIFFAIIYQKNK